MPKVIPKVVDQLAEESAFLWQLRDAAVSAPHYSLDDLARLDARVEDQLDGLRAMGEPGWGAVAQNLESGQAGEVFAAGVLALRAGDPEKIQTAFEAGTASPEAARGLISALGWLPYEQASPHIRTLLNASDPPSKSAGIAASAIHRKSPGPALPSAFRSDDPRLKARAFRAAGELGLASSHAALSLGIKSSHPAVRFWAAWSDVLLTGDKTALGCLRSMAEAGGCNAERAVGLVVRRLATSEAVNWVRRLMKDLGQVRLAVVGAGALGDPQVIPFLIERMNVPKLARVAGESFSLITGAQIAYDQLEAEQPEGFESGPSEDPNDERVAMDADQDLYWPDPALIQKWWGARQSNFKPGVRYLLGKPITEESAAEALQSGYQRQRAAAAIELAILKPGKPLFEVRAPGARQRKLLFHDT